MLPRGDRFRSSPLPGGNFGIDPRTMTPNEIEIALQQARHGAQSYDYFGDHPSMRQSSNPTSPYSYSPRHEEQFNFGSSQHGTPFQNGNGHNQSPNLSSLDSSLPELVRRTNLAVSLANQSINPRGQFTLVHPMMCFDGRFPTDFRSPKTLESVKLLDVTQLDRILQEYKLPYDTRMLVGRDQISSTRLRQAKLQILFEHLGASRVVEQERQKRP